MAATTLQSKKVMKSFVVLLALCSLCHSFQSVGVRYCHNTKSLTNDGSRIYREGCLKMKATVLPSTEESSVLMVNPPQIVEFIEPKTNVKVILIGTMHYNPTSIDMVKETVDALGKQEILGSVLIESCDVRWNTTKELSDTPRGSFLNTVLMSEMKAASDKAMSYGRPVVLGDQRINITGTSLKNTFKQTFTDIVTPLGGGWERLYTDFKEAADVALPSGSGYLDARSFLDPRLLIAAPISFAKYPLAFLARNPLSTTIVLSALVGLSILDTSASYNLADATVEGQITSSIASLLFACLELVFFGRIMVQVLLAERNEILARNILEQCRIYSNGNKKSGPDFDFVNMFSFLSQKKVASSSTQSEIVYVPESLLGASIDSSKDGKEKVVVAVLGMAHCNGIVKLLKEELVK